MFATEPVDGLVTPRNPDSPLQHFFLSTTHNLFLSELNFWPCPVPESGFLSVVLPLLLGIGGGLRGLRSINVQVKLLRFRYGVPPLLLTQALDPQP
jgi:hypothetical protein